MSQSPYAMFKTDGEAEKSGIKLNYGPFWIFVARSGGANKRFQRLLEAKMKPYRRAIQTETIDEKVAEALLRDAFVDGCVLGWGSEKFGEGKIEGETGDAVEFSKESCVKLFTDLPELYKDVQEQAGKVSLFRATSVEEDAGN